VVALTAADQAKTFVLPPGYRMEPVLSDPDVISPAVIEWDGDGRMYVAEFITYMRDVEGNGQREPINRITRFEDTNADGTYDKRTVFADKLVLPRFILTLADNSILTNETDSDDVIKLTDTNNDGVADKREVFYTGVGTGRDGNLEHMQSGFVWGLDNWIYSTYNSFRFRWTPTGIQREPTGANQGQWGLTQDDDGKMWWVNAGSERGPGNFHVPIQYGSFTRLDGEFEEGFDVVWPIAGVGDIQGGMGRVRMPIGTLNHFTATGGAEIVRGHRVPEDLKGDLLFTEPVGRLIRRAKIEKSEGLTTLKNAYPGSEFILSTDLLFRPVNIKTGPDGSLYIVDMYHGIIQEAQWTGPGSYLRAKIQQYQMDKIIAHGRIWRLRYDGKPAVPATPAGPAARPTPAVPAVPAIPLDLARPAMLTATPAQLVAHLSHANGWWRDTAQRLLVLEQDKSIVPALENIVRTSDNLVGRFHALWTLEGLNAMTPELVRVAIKDPNPRMRIQGIRASESLYKKGNRTFADDYRAATKDTDVDVALQGILTLNVLKVADAPEVIKAAMGASKARGIQVIGGRLTAPPQVGRGGGAPGGGFTPEEQAMMQTGQTAYQELCYSCHGDDGRGTPKSGGAPGDTMAPAIAGSAHVQGHRDFVIKTLLGGLTGPNNGKEYTEVMIPMAAQTDQWIASVASFVRNSFGNSESFVSVADVARVRAATKNRRLPWTVEELNASLPVLLQTLPTWKASASHATENASRGLTTQGWSSGTQLQPGMWFQVELPEATMVTEVQFSAPGAGRGGGGGGGRGRGAAPAAGGQAGAPPAGPAAAPAAGAPTATPPATAAAAPAGRAQGAGRGTAPLPPTTRAFSITTSLDGTRWSAPVATGPINAQNFIAFNPVRAKFVRITQTAATESNAPFAIINLRLFGPGPGVAAAR
jgi:mono/diheme cytochrome c family protein/glucose/arabinose dehydrogenase